MAAITELTDARESLAYWEGRARRLPRLALRRRREARTMAARWRMRVSEAERAAYGRGFAGALLLLATERRLPQATVHTGRILLRRTLQAVAVTALTLVAGFTALTVLIVSAIL